MTALKIADLQRDAREEGISIGLERGIERGAYQTKLETARKLIVRGDSPEDVAKLVGLSVIEVQELLNN